MTATKWVIVLISSLMLLGAVFGAAASISVGGVEDLAAGSVMVNAPTGVEIIGVTWVLKADDNTIVSGVDVTFAIVSSGTDDCVVSFSDGCRAYITLKGLGGVPLTVATELIELSTAFNTTETFPLNGNSQPVASIQSVEITVIDPN